MDKFVPIIWVPSNWLKFSRGVHCYMLTTILILIFSKFFSFMFFGQIWSQNLKFFQLTKNWYRGRVLYAYFNFDVYFFKFFVIHIFLGKIFFHNLKFCKITKILLRGALLYAYYDLNLSFFKIFVNLIFLVKTGLKTLSSPNWLKFHRGVHYYMLITTLMFIFSKTLSFI